MACSGPGSPAGSRATAARRSSSAWLGPAAGQLELAQVAGALGLEGGGRRASPPGAGPRGSSVRPASSSPRARWALPRELYDAPHPGLVVHGEVLVQRQAEQGQCLPVVAPGVAVVAGHRVLGRPLLALHHLGFPLRRRGAGGSQGERQDEQGRDSAASEVLVPIALESGLLLAAGRHAAPQQRVVLHGLQHVLALVQGGPPLLQQAEDLRLGRCSRSG